MPETLFLEVCCHTCGRCVKRCLRALEDGAKKQSECKISFCPRAEEVLEGQPRILIRSIVKNTR